MRETPPVVPPHLRKKKKPSTLGLADAYVEAVMRLGGPNAKEPPPPEHPPIIFERGYDYTLEEIREICAKVIAVLQDSKEKQI